MRGCLESMDWGKIVRKPLINNELIRIQLSRLDLAGIFGALTKRRVPDMGIVKEQFASCPGTRGQRHYTPGLTQSTCNGLRTCVPEKSIGGQRKVSQIPESGSAPSPLGHTVL